MISAEKFLETIVEKARMEPKSIRDELKEIPTGGLITLLKFCQQRAGKDLPRKNYGYVHQDLVNILGEKLGFKVEYGEYSHGVDGVWSYGDITIIIESKTSSQWLKIEQISNYVKKKKASSGLLIAPDFTQDQVKAAIGFGNVRLLTTEGLSKLIKLKEMGKLKTKDIVKMFVPQEAVRVDYVIDIIYSIVKPLEKPSELEVKPQKWSYEEIKKYLDDVKRRNKYTYAYYKVLSEVDDRISREKLLKRMGKILGEEVTGFQLAGVQAGIMMTVIKKMKKERIDGKDKDGRNFWLNEKYKNLVKRYFTEVK